MNLRKQRQIRFFFGFSVAIVLVIGVGGATWLTLHKQVEEQKMVKHTYNVLNQAHYIEQLMIDMETGRRGFRCTNDIKFLDPYYKSQPKLAGAVEELAKLVSNNRAQIAKVNKLELSTQRVDSLWKAINISTIYASQEEKRAVTIFEKQCMDVVRADVANIINEEKALLVMREQAGTISLKQTISTVIVGDALILIIVALLIRLIMQEYGVRLQAEKKLGEKLEELKRLNDDANRKNWQLTGVREINSCLMGDDALYVLMEACLRKIADYTEAPAAAFYFYNVKLQKLQLIAREGLPGNAHTTIELNEGVVGKAATRRELTVIKDVPKDHWKIESATGDSIPDTIILVPLWLKNELKGVIELPIFGRWADRIADLMDSVSDNIAIALQAADTNDKLHVLLAKVQEQKEELESQQEELRQTNEELTHQADVLRASEEELKTQEEELRQTNAELELKTEAVEASSRELQLKAAELQQSSTYKSQFLANMSHELRTPLNSVLILANILKQNKTNNLTEKQLEYAKTIHKSGTDLLTLINDILDLTKIEVGKVDMFFDDVRIKEISNDMDLLFTALANDKHIKFNIEHAPGLPEVINTDKQRLVQIVRNLLSNAFKFTPEKGTVTLRFEAHDGMLAISVKDTGIGIPADKQKLIFEAFQQADGSTSRKYGGTGLGLAISRELANKLLGDITVSSIPGHGSTFTVTVPLETGVTPNSVAGDTPQEKIIYSLDDVKEQTKIADDRARVKSGENYILIIEDDIVFAGIVNNYAHKRGYKTMVAMKGDEGLLYAKQYKPLAIILDLGLPVIDGRSIIKILKSDPELRDIPVHVITAEDRDNLSSTAIDSFSVKPIQPNDLEQAFYYIESYLKEHYKNIMLLDPDNGKLAHIFDTLTSKRNSGIIYDVAQDVAAAKELLQHKSPDCIITDISSDIEKGIETLKELKAAAPAGTYMITCLEGDISQADERTLKQYSDSIIRKSSLAADRLLDEVALFLHKLKDESKPHVPEQFSKITDNVLNGKKVLLADDDMRNVFALTAALEEQGMTVLAAEDGKVAIDMMQADDSIQIVLMDVMMPEIDGYEAIRRIRQMPRYATVPIIALTARATVGDKDKCIAAGASDYATKPVDNNKLFSLMRVWLS